VSPAIVGAKHILVVEDDEVIREVLRFNLVREGYEVSEAATGVEALEKARRLRPDLIVLDLMLPELGGLEVCRILRQETRTPMLMLSARDSELDKIVGLQVGADDYMTKPFSVAELAARITALLRRAPHAVEEHLAVEVEELGDFRFDRGARSVRVGADEARFSPKEFDLLSYLLAHPGRVHSREHLIRNVWGPDVFAERTVDVHVRCLREKFEGFVSPPFRITTVYGIGYRLDRIAIPTSAIGHAQPRH
jgi:DNA-binding response OmpR family regulator